MKEKELFLKNLKKLVKNGDIKVSIFGGDFYFIFKKTNLNLILSLFGNNDLFKISQRGNECFLFSKNNAAYAAAYLRYLIN